MKKSIFFTAIITTLLCFSCASNKVEDDYSYDYADGSYENGVMPDAPKVTEDFLGDFDVIELESLMFLQKSNGNVKPKEINKVYLVPRSNNVEFHFRDAVNSCCFILSYAERQKILNACQTFLDQFEQKTLPHHKINSKTAYVASKCSLWFGLMSPASGSEQNDYFVNCEFINKQPFLLLQFLPTRCEKSSNAFTPKISLYMSPTQIKAFMETLKQENLNAKVEELNKKAYTY